MSEDIEKPHGGTNSNATSGVDPVAGKTFAEVLGEITWLLTQDPQWHGRHIKTIEDLVMPAILLRQFHINYVQIDGSGATDGEPKLQPVSMVAWAMVNEVVARRLQDAGGEGPKQSEWRCGNLRHTVVEASISTTEQSMS